MDSGRCRKCGRAFAAGEVAGIGILRTRPAERGGPIVEFACPGCQTVMTLVPYGQGRYALPGQPPPPPPTDAERTMPWKQRNGTPAKAPVEEPPAPPRFSTPPPPVKSRPPAESPPTPPPPPPPRLPDRRMTTLEAFAALGLSPAAVLADVEKAYRERALLCHPDKVAHLDADFAELANRKFRRLQEARDLLVLILDRSADPSGDCARGSR